MKKAQLANTAIHREALEAAGQKLNATGPSGGVVKDKNGRDRSKDIGRVRNKKRPAEDFVFMEGTRKSSRQSGVLQDPVLIEERRKAEDEFFAAQQEELNKAKHAPRDLVALHGVVGSGTTEELIVRLERLAMEPVPPPVERSTGEPTEDATEAEVEALQEQLNTIVFRGIAKVVPERIYSIAVHPSTTKDIVFAGDKQGAVAYWDATAAAEGDLESSPHYYWKAHQHTVADLKFAPNDPTRLYSASYDATIRRTDLNTGRSEEVIDVDRFAYDGLVHSIDFSPDGNEIWAVDNHGGLLHRDIREPMETTRRWGIDRAKIGCFSLNAANPYLAATGHLKRITKLWDLRKLTGMPQEATEEELNSCVIKTFDYAKACSSAFFDHSGTRLLSTSYDDFIRVWNINPHDLESIRESEFVPKFEEPHNNQSGRYVSVLKARWANHGASHFSIGGMSQGLEVFNGATGQMMASLNDQLVTAVPAVTATHPTRPMRFYGGTGSGKLHFFAPPEPESE
ncbi:WD repeat protein [Pseudohyphozyma bogoriensis]|nr:WD repeat protein [Pseudohyphozyma bogoriensis]